MNYQRKQFTTGQYLTVIAFVVICVIYSVALINTGLRKEEIRNYEMKKLEYRIQQLETHPTIIQENHPITQEDFDKMRLSILRDIKPVLDRAVPQYPANAYCLMDGANDTVNLRCKSFK